MDTDQDPQELPCSHCQQSIVDEYFGAGGLPYCPPCKQDIFEKPPGCSGYLPSVGFALLGALAGALLDFTVTASTGTQYGLVALAIGGMVGWGVRKGSRGRGSRLHQVMAVCFTYLAISWSLSGLVLKEIVSPSEPVAIETPAPEIANQVVTLPDVGATPEAASTPQDAATPESTPTPEPESQPSETAADVADEEPPTALALVIGVVVILLGGLIMPLFAVYVDPVTFVLYILAMWQAASMVKPTEIVGPLSLKELNSQDPAEPPPEAGY